MSIAPMDAAAASHEPPARKWFHPYRIVGFLVENWFLIGIGVVIVLAWRFPQVAKEHGILKSEYSIHYGCIAAIFLITGLTLSTQALYRQALNLKLHLTTQIFSFLFFPSVLYAIINIIRKAQGLEGSINRDILIGLMFLGCTPTTVASNITMTRSAMGNTEAATIEVCLGNLMGVFITPLLLDMFLRGPWEYGAPIADGGQTGADGLRLIYKQLAKQLGLALFVPLFVGQVVQNILPKQTKWVATTFRLPKVSTFLLLILIWSVFSTQFANGAFERVSTESIILVVFLSLSLYLIFTVLCLLIIRLPFLPKSFFDPVRPGTRLPFWRRMLRKYRFGKKEATALCFCAAAKGLVVGTPVLDILYGGFEPERKAIISIPMVLYQGEQVFVAQILVYFFRRWNQVLDGPAMWMEPDDKDSPKASHDVPQAASGGRGGEFGKHLVEPSDRHQVDDRVVKT